MTKFYIFLLLSGLFLFQSKIYSQDYSACLALKSLKIVVIGSSTAAGTGVSHSDSAWVNRYRKHLVNINANNEVINLARGGYHTYALMPDNFVPPANRPSPDSARNISRAIALNPDAIIINLPSNDNSLGFLMQEQLSNFDSIVNTSHRAGIPIWVCTTQPINYGTQVKRDTQAIVRDSIFSRYGDFAIDFWMTIADSLGSIKAEYDSGDGTHLNDAGHAILNNRVVEKNIPVSLFEMQSDVDYGIEAILEYKGYYCDDESIDLGIVYGNYGLPDTIGVNALMHLEHCLDNALTSVGNITFHSEKVCELDTVFVSFAATSSDCAFVTQLAQSSGYTQDDKISINLDLFDSPEILVRDTSACGPSAFELQASFLNTDSLQWQNLSDTTMILSMTADLITPVLDTTQTYVLKAFNSVKGEGNLRTKLETNRDWNGMMTDVYAHETISIDSIYMRFSTAGNQMVQISLKQGSILGYEQDASAWTMFYQDSMTVDSLNLFHWINIPPLKIEKGDTIGLYFKMADPSARLAYFAESSNQIFENRELIITNGTGISTGFSATYFPRSFVGEMNYQILYDSSAYCKDRAELKVVISEPEIDLGPDVSIAPLDSIFLGVAGDFESYSWSTAENTDSIRVIGSELNQDQNLFFLTVTDQWGCTASDTIIISFETVNLEDESDNQSVGDFQLSPNPVMDGFVLSQNSNKSEKMWIEILNAVGKSVHISESTSPYYIDCSTWLPGYYWVKISNGNRVKMLSVFKSD